MKPLYKPLGVVTGLLLLLTYLLVQSRSPDLVLRARMHEGLQALMLRDAELTRDVLLARAGVLANYDALTQAGSELRTAIEGLRRHGAAASGDAARDIGPRVDALAHTVQRKLVLVEYFKSDNALLRNSSTYVAHAGQRLGRPLHAGRRAGVADIADVSQAMLRFMQSPDTAAGEAVRGALDRLARAPGLGRDGQLLATHGWLVADVLPKVDDVLREIVGAPVAADAEAVQDVVLRHASRIDARAQTFRLLLYVVAVVLLAYLLYQFVRLRAGARALLRANLDLGREMAERQEAASALRASEERFRAITESANDAIVSADRGGRIVSWNPSAEAIYGYHRDEILGEHVGRLLPAGDRRAHAARFARRVAARAFRRSGQTVELTGRRKDGREFPIEISLSTWTTAHGQYVTAMIRDLTARRALEETARQQELQLIQANKMTALGTLVSGVAHEINNPNQVVLMNAGVLRDAWEDALVVLDGPRPDHVELSLAGLPYAEMRAAIPTLLQEIRDGAGRIERIVGDLKDFARPRPRNARGRFALNEAVQRALRLLAHAIRTRTSRFEVRLAPDMPVVEGDVQQVEQVVVNLVMNALEALPDRDRGVRVSTAVAADEHAAVLEVRDEGIGIPAEHLPRLRDPFFTTKLDSGGTGLGLAISASLVRAHGGRLDFASEPGRGTRASVTLPLAAIEHPAAALGVDARGAGAA